MDGRSLYQILQVDPKAEQEVIEAAYRRLARKHHPDVSRAADAARRMKEFNAAYSVLGDRARRAAYDRELHQRAAPTTARPRREPAPGPTCRLHPFHFAAGRCRHCGVGLCADCFEQFHPPMCTRCVLAWTGRRRMELLLPVIWFFVCIVFVGGLLAGNQDGPGPAPSRAMTLTILALTYVVASVPCAWRLGSAAAEPANVWAALLGAVLVGPVIAPFRIAKILVWDLAQVGHLVALATRTEQGQA